MGRERVEERVGGWNAPSGRTLAMHVRTFFKASELSEYPLASDGTRVRPMNTIKIVYSTLPASLLTGSLFFAFNMLLKGVWFDGNMQRVMV